MNPFYTLSLSLSLSVYLSICVYYPACDISHEEAEPALVPLSSGPHPVRAGSISTDSRCVSISGCPPIFGHPQEFGSRQVHGTLV